MRAADALALDQPRESEHAGDAGDKDEQREDQVVEAEPFPGHMRELAAEEMADAARDRPLVGEHLVERPHHAVGAENPDEIEPAQGVERSDPHPRCRRGFDETLGWDLQHWMRKAG